MLESNNYTVYFIFAYLAELKLVWYCRFGVTQKSSWMEMGKSLICANVTILHSFVVITLLSTNCFSIAVVSSSTLQIGIISSSRPQYRACGKCISMYICIVYHCMQTLTPALKTLTLFNFCKTLAICRS